MPIIHTDHSRARAKQRGATKAEIEQTIEMGAQTVLADQSVFKKAFDFCGEHNGKYFILKHVIVRAIWEHPNWIVKTVIVKYGN